MEINNTQNQIEEMKVLLNPWHESLAHPKEAQESVLEQLLKSYNKTEYGKEHNSENVGSYADFKSAFPVKTYEEFKPLIAEVLKGNTHALFSEEPVVVALTKGTSGESKEFPYTQSHIELVRKILKLSPASYSVFKNDISWMLGYQLNIVPTPSLRTIKVGNKELACGYSLAVAVILMADDKSSFLEMIPSRDEIGLLPKESNKTNWEKRYELAYQRAHDKNVTMFGTMPTIAFGFSDYLKENHNLYPKDIWQIKYFPISGYVGVNTFLAPKLHFHYGKSIDIWESYGTSEAPIGLQMDGKKAWSPFYDQLLLEVQTINGIKQLHEMYPGEIGSLIISTTEYPRYRIGDLILAFEPPYFRCIGREYTKLHPYSFGELKGKSALILDESKNLPSWR